MYSENINGVSLLLFMKQKSRAIRYIFFGLYYLGVVFTSRITPYIYRYINGSDIDPKKDAASIANASIC
ncbi:hypothetical protein DFQ11_106171 [Winogradskyella epiphytica]|uniref:Uncharacterized protein n=1 Tax=Winogradskyella epiphytica TaxID=262005 RepID=A0A2V4XGX9_9FLAO|nr:hypothetical protein DFQ11_106171 [Winogradskyella epiphytica]GGW70814.1 hypothetical protein GCM10008085_23690 [Winogradskyella epiphytica]